MCNCRYECAYLAVIISIISGVVLGVLYALDLVMAGVLFWAYILIGALGILLTPIYGLGNSSDCRESCFCRYRGPITISGAGAIIFAAIGLVVQFIAPVTVFSIIIGVATFFAVLLISLIACFANCICED